MHVVDALAEQAIGGLSQGRLLNVEGFGKPLSGHGGGRSRWGDQLEVAEGDGVKEDPDPAGGSHRLAQAV